MNGRTMVSAVSGMCGVQVIRLSVPCSWVLCLRWQEYVLT